MKEILKVLYTSLIILAIFGVGVWFGRRSMEGDYEKRMEVFEEVIESRAPEKQQLMNKIDSLDLVIKNIRNTEHAIDTVRILEVEKIANLPLDSATMYLKQKILEYEKKFATKTYI